MMSKNLPLISLSKLLIAIEKELNAVSQINFKEVIYRNTQTLYAKSFLKNCITVCCKLVSYIILGFTKFYIL